MPAPVPWSLSLPTNFYIDDEFDWQHEDGLLLIPPGTGLIWSDGRRFRVVDTWLSFDKHGQFDLGAHVFLEQVTKYADDRPGRIASDYFDDAPRPPRSGGF